MMSLYGQETEEQTEAGVVLDPVVITGTGTQHRLKETPVPVEVITSANIRKAGITDFQQAMTMLAPSLSFLNNARGSNLMMNGLSNKYVLVLINGKKLTGDTEYNVDISRIDMTRVKRIEILKGAGSALYGSDAISGVINIITDEPDNLLTISSATKSDGYGQFFEGANVDVSTPKFGSYTSYIRQQSDGWILNHFNEAGDEIFAMSSDRFRSNVINQRFTLTPSDALSFYAEGGYYNRLVKRIVPAYSYNLGYDAYNLGAGVKYNLNERSHIQLDLQNDNYNTNYIFTQDVTDSTGEHITGEEERRKGQHYYNAHLKSLFRFTENTQTVFGAEYLSEALVRRDANVDKNVYTLAVYGQEEIRFLQRFQAVVGVRYMYHANAGSNITPKASLMYQTNHFNFRAQYSAGFRAPGINELYYFTFSTSRGNSVLTVGNDRLSAEKSHYGSLNAEYHNNWLTVSVTGYANQLHDMINSRTTNMADMTPDEQQAVKDEAFPYIGDDVSKIRQVKRYANDEQAVVKGVEGNVNIFFGAGFSLGGNYTYADARTKDAEMGWRPVERSIRHTGSLNTNYSHAWKHYRLNVNLNGRLQSKRIHITTAGVDESAPGYGIWNISTNHTFDGLKNFTIEPGIGVNNIFDKVDDRPYGVNYSHLSPGRTVYVSLLLKFKK